MTNRKTTRRALFMSVISLMLCCAMLVGTTFAWFTDSVTSGDNIITAGNLDIELYHSDKNATEERVSTNTALFDDVELWEPGAVVYENFKVANEGNLTLKYQLKLNFTDATTTEDGRTLADVLKVAVVPNGFEGDRAEAKALWESNLVEDEYLATFARSNTLNPKDDKGDIDEYGVVIYWEPTDNDNFYNMKADGGAAKEPLTIKVNVELFATQVEAEVDSFDNTYDDEAYDDLELPDVIAEVQNIEDLEKALQAGKTAKLMTNLTLDRMLDVPADTTAAIDLNGKTLTLTGAAARAFSLRANLGGGFNILGALIISDSATGGKIEIAEAAGGIVVDSDADLQINGGAISVAEGATGVTAIGGASVDVKGGEISGDGDAIAVVAGDEGDKADIKIGADASVKNVDVADGAEIKLTYQGEKPELNGVDEEDVFVGTDYDGVYVNPDNAAVYEVYDKVGLLNANTMIANATTGEGHVLTIKLMDDIDLAGANWKPINKMWIDFDGNGHKISNLTAEGWRAGLFGYLGGGSIKNLTLENVTVTGAQVGAFAGAVEGKIENCTLTGTKNVITWAPKYQDGGNLETWNGIGAVCGVMQPMTVNVTIAEGAYVALIKAGFTTDEGCKFVDNLTGYIGTNAGTVTNNGTVVTRTITREGFVLDTKDNGEVVLYKVSADYADDTVNVPEGVTTIGSNAFAQNSNVKTVILSSTVRDLEKAFEYSMVEKVVLNEGLETISSRAFIRTNALKEVVIPSTVKTIADNAFQKSAIKEIVIPATVETVGETAFGASMIEKVTFEGNTSIQGYAFRGCTKLREVYMYGEDVTFIPSTLSGRNSMWFCNGESNNPNTSDIDFYVKNDTVAARVKTAMGAEANNTDVYVVAPVKTAEELSVALQNNADVLLTADLDLSGSAWTPIGTSEAPFSGTFNGNGRTISGLTISGVEEGAFFNYIADGAVIKNVKFADVDIDGKYVATVAQYAENATIENVKVLSGNVDSNGYAAGIIMQSVDAEIKNCENNATITSTFSASGIGAWLLTTTVDGCTNNGNVSGGNRAGGICGNFSGTITNCINNGEVVSTGGMPAGGIVGVLSGASTFESCTNNGNVSATGTDAGNANAGGILGQTPGSSATIKGCTNNGAITAENSTAAGIGISHYGGITATDCANTGDVYGKTGAEGTVAAKGMFSATNTVTNCTNSGTVTKG